MKKEYEFWFKLPQENKTPHGQDFLGSIEAETKEDAWELWRLQHPQYWKYIDLAKFTFEGKFVWIIEGSGKGRVLLI